MKHNSISLKSLSALIFAITAAGAMRMEKVETGPSVRSSICARCLGPRICYTEQCQRLLKKASKECKVKPGIPSSKAGKRCMAKVVNKSEKVCLGCASVTHCCGIIAQ